MRWEFLLNNLLMRAPPFTQGVESQPNSYHSSIRPTFGIACWVLALLAFLQLISVGTALALRTEQPASGDGIAVAVASLDLEPIQPRTVEQILQDITAQSVYAVQMTDSGLSSEPGQPSSGGAAAVSPPRSEPNHGSVYPIAVIANPRVERLVQESRSLHLGGDMMRAMLKLDEASRLDKNECAVIYQKGILFEGMGIFTKAADQYQQIQQMGLQKAGVYFNLATAKLTKGMDTAAVRRDTIAIGPMKVNKARGFNAGRHVEVAITLLARPDLVVQADDVEVQVHFYDKVNGGDVKKAAPNALIKPYWADAKVDWQDVGNEETLRVSYTIPEADRAEEHLFGRREYYGYIVELIYKGEVVDQQAHPRRLHSVHGESEKLAPLYPDDLGLPWLPEGDNSLLPSKDVDYGDSNALPIR